MSSQSVTLTNIGKGFGTTKVLKGIDLDIQAGEFLSLVGMSGCGKSTLLRIIAGLETADQGRVAINGADVTGTDPTDRNLAMVFQSYALYPHMSVRQNIATPLRMRRLKLIDRLPLIGRLTANRAVLREIDHAVEQAAEVLQISALLDRKPAQLSGGQRQRVALARALVRQPAAFLMDEPLSNLDAKLRAHMRDELAALHKRLGATFIYVTHDQVEAMTMSDRIALMSEGRIEQLGTPDELYRRPANLTVARFIGAPTINLLPAESLADGRLRLLGEVLDMRIRQAGPVTLGLRAEDIHLAAKGLPARVTRIETHGADRYVTCCLLADETLSVTLRQSASLPRPSGQVHLGFAPEALHVFGADGQRLTPRLRQQVVA
ncbi:ABC transporter ATP-binding protein (plasmid) [Thioclava litoralis]|uniref:ABC transporter ATP-binding protein n=1 Tax=Thioclava litoralis TaxID=3076557 RepID=A0ABZ1E3R3_9RHOB|nr:ABC transporter ATP-binding protein [Thioclava sp. FTW29]